MPRCELPVVVVPRCDCAGRDRLLACDPRWQPCPEWFDPDWHRAQGLVRGEGTGRGAALYSELAGVPVVLRHYRRGGAVRRLLGDRYLWTGLRATRAWRELALLARLDAAGLPVPRPVAARVRREPGTLFYRADLLSERVPATSTLTQALVEGPLAAPTWRSVGATIARFHRAGVEHADLNAHNILLDENGSVYLIDFDRGRLRRSTGRWCERNLQRLHRSLTKLATLEPRFHFDAAAWAELTAGYGPVAEEDAGFSPGA